MTPPLIMIPSREAHTYFETTRIVIPEPWGASFTGGASCVWERQALPGI